MVYSRLNDAYESVEYFQNLHEIHEKVINVDMSGELPEQEIIFKYLPRNAKVLELGGNIGRASIVINKILENPKDHVVLESDPDIANELIKNRQANHCQFIVVNKALSKTPMIQKDWNAKNVKSTIEPLPEGWKHVPTITMEELIRRYPIRFDTLVADCEGCLEPIFKSYPYILDRIHTIIIENDAEFIDGESNNFIKTFIKKQGFHSVECRPHQHIQCFYQVWKRKQPNYF